MQRSSKISALSSGKIDKYEHLTRVEILPPELNRKTEQAELTYLHSAKQQIKIT